MDLDGSGTALQAYPRGGRLKEALLALRVPRRLGTAFILPVAIAPDVAVTIRGGDTSKLRPAVEFADTLRAGDVAGVSPCLVAPDDTAALPSRPYPSASSRARRMCPSAGVSRGLRGPDRKPFSGFAGALASRGAPFGVRACRWCGRGASVP